MIMESGILKVLMNNSNINSYHPKLSVDCVQRIAECISNILYESLTTNLGSHTNCRLSLLLLLHKWFTLGRHNLKIDISNYSCLVDCLLDINSKQIHAFNENQHDYSSASELTFENQDVITEMEKYFIEQQHLCLNRIKLQERVENLGQQSTNKISHSNTFSSRLSELVFISEKLALLKSEKKCFEINETSKINRSNLCTSQSSKKSRKIKVRVAYSLLNLNQSNNDLQLLQRIIKEFAGYKKLLAEETEFINYVWHSNGIFQEEPALLSAFLEQFPFLYEKEMLNLCKNLVVENDFDTKVLTKQVEKIIKMCEINKQLLQRVKSMLYILFSYSDYNKNLLKFINLFESLK